MNTQFSILQYLVYTVLKMGVGGQVSHLIQYHCSYLLWFTKKGKLLTAKYILVLFDLPRCSWWSSCCSAHCTASLRESVAEEREGGGDGNKVEVPATLSILSPEADSGDSVPPVS